MRDDISGLNRDNKCFEEENIMKKEEFVALGISEELAEKAATASADELKGYIPKSRFDEVNTAKGNAEKSYNDIKAELEKLKASAGDNEALQTQITDLQTQLKDAENKHKEEIAEMKMSNAIHAALGDSVQDADLVAGLLDRSKLILGDDGKVTGLDEQIKGLKESKAFLFKPEDKGGKNGNNVGFRVGSTNQGGSTGVGSEGENKVDLKAAIAAKMESQKG